MNNGFKIGNHNAERIINIGTDERVKELEQQVSDLDTALIITKNSRNHHIEIGKNLSKLLQEAILQLDKCSIPETSDELTSLVSRSKEVIRKSLGE